MNPQQLLQWYAEIGADEAIGDEALDRTKIVPVPEKAAVLHVTPKPLEPLAVSTAAAPESAAPAPVDTAEAEQVAAVAQTLDDLRAAIDTFPGFASLRRLGTEMVFADGPAQAKVLVIGETPFAGETAQMLGKMLAAIGLSPETNARLAPVLNWRPAGNRAPEESDIALSLPFIRRHIALLAPTAILLVGGAPAKILLGTKEQPTRLRGQWLSVDGIPAIVLLHPEYLARNPAQKKLAWEDLQMFQAKLKELGVF